MLIDTVDMKTTSLRNGPRAYVRLKPTKHGMKFWWRGILVAVALRGADVGAEPFSLGASMGLILPSNQLVSRNDLIGAALLPGPSVGLHAVREGLAGRSDLSLEGQIELGLFESRVNPALRTQYLPLEVAASWEAASLEELSLRVRAGGGPVLISTNLGARRSVLLPQTCIGGEVVRSLHHLTVALDVSVGVLWQSGIQNVVRARVIVLTR